MCGWAVGGTVGCCGISLIGSVVGSVVGIGSYVLVGEVNVGTFVGIGVGSSMV